VAEWWSRKPTFRAVAENQSAAQLFLEASLERIRFKALVPDSSRKFSKRPD